jgi:predicted metal-dependent RNase
MAREKKKKKEIFCPFHTGRNISTLCGPFAILFSTMLSTTTLSKVCKLPSRRSSFLQNEKVMQRNSRNGRKVSRFCSSQYERRLTLRPYSTVEDALKSIITIDCNYMEKRDYASAYLLHNRSHAAFIDNNTNQCVPKMMQTLSDQGLTPSDVEYIIITHAHLDHAGGTGQLAELCPKAQVLAHPVRAF